MINAILLMIIRDQGFGLDAVLCISQLALVIIDFAFINDTDIINAAKSVNTKEDLLLKQQQVVDTWEGILMVSGEN